MYKIFLCSFILMINSCGSKLTFNSKMINEITVKHLETGIIYNFKDTEQIRILIDDYINENKQYIAKSKATYHIVFYYKNKETLLIISGQYLKHDKKTYHMKKNLDEYLNKICKN